MPAIPLYPLNLRPALHVKVWGGRKLEALMNKPLPSAEPYGESWEVHDSVQVSNGPLRGNSLGELTRQYGADLIGANNDPAAGFPLLAKMLNAEAWLSIQVHPNDEQAAALEGEPRGKTEAWVILDAEPGAKLIIGLKPGTTRAQMAAAIRCNVLEEMLVYAEVQAGDVLYIPANTVHALGPGILMYEIQQSSDITYRLYDWGRLGLDGQPRDLHIEKAVQVANLDGLPRVTHPEGALLVDGEYFRTWRHRLHDDGLQLNAGGKFHCLTCVSGALNVAAEGHEPLQLATGVTGLIPACVERFTLRGDGVVLRSCQR